MEPDIDDDEEQFTTIPGERSPDGRIQAITELADALGQGAQFGDRLRNMPDDELTYLANVLPVDDNSWHLWWGYLQDVYPKIITDLMKYTYGESPTPQNSRGKVQTFISYLLHIFFDMRVVGTISGVDPLIRAVSTGAENRIRTGGYSVQTISQTLRNVFNEDMPTLINRIMQTLQATGQGTKREVPDSEDEETEPQPDTKRNRVSTAIVPYEAPAQQAPPAPTPPLLLGPIQVLQPVRRPKRQVTVEPDEDNGRGEKRQRLLPLPIPKKPRKTKPRTPRLRNPGAQPRVGVNTNPEEPMAQQGGEPEPAVGTPKKTKAARKKSTKTRLKESPNPNTIRTYRLQWIISPLELKFLKIEIVG